MFKPVDPKQSFPNLEEEILKYWQEEDIFKRSMLHRKDGESFSFYDGPPFATGLPHYGHLLAGTIKDVIPRYQTMQGKYVKRRFGWDCHGLPVENMIEKENELHNKRDIEALGVKNFNNLCRTAVLRYTQEWRKTVERMGRFVDMDWDYRTMDPDYMESIWWVFKQLYSQGLIYEGYKSMYVCPRCETPLSNFEVTQAYKDITDYTATVKFPLVDEANTYVLAWTTTPWTLPGNLFLAVHPEIDYVKIKWKADIKRGDIDAKVGDVFILAKARLLSVFKDQYDAFELITTMKGTDLLRKKYKPLFPYFAEKYQAQDAFRIVHGDFVTTEDGTGVVHIAPGFGPDDFEVGKREKTDILQHVGIDGKFVSAVGDGFAGMDVKPKDDPTKADKKIVKWLDERGLILKAENFRHSYAHCWRCDTPLLNSATTSWFVAVEKIKDKLLAANAKTDWVPANIKDGRFGKWLEGARDWAISRNRYWGTPLPIWRNRHTGEIEVIGSRDELMMKAPGRFTKITIARHAQSKGNVDRIYQGKVPGTKLTPEGKKQAKALADSVYSEQLPIQTIYHSPLMRTTETARAVADKTGAKLIVDDRLREVEFGEYEGKHVDFDDLAFIRARRAHKFENQQVESVYHFDGMETWSSIEVRCKAFLEEILERHRGEHIMIVTHADILLNFTHLFTGIDKNKIVHQPYPGLAGHRTFYYDHETREQMDLHKETVDSLQWATGADHAHHSVNLTVVRHGETDWNKEGRMQGRMDIPLNTNGVLQAEELAARLDPKEYDVIISSTLGRAKQTADIIAGKWQKEVLTSDLFCERHFGEWEGKTKTDILKMVPHLVQEYLHLADPPKGESREELRERVRKGRSYLMKEFAGKRVLLVSHGRWISAFNALENDNPIWKPIENASVQQYTLKPHLQRIPDVLDCWFESGSMPYAQEHYPFEAGDGKSATGKTMSDKRLAASKNKKKNAKVSHAADNSSVTNRLPLTANRSSVPNFPAQFIAEGLDQTRGWFYTLTVLSAALFDSPAFEHVIVNGTVLAEDGKKMSKKLKNYPEPLEVVKKFGADAVRFALMSSPAVRGEDLRFSEKFVEETVRNVLLPLWNAYNLFVTYANGVDWKKPKDFSLAKAKSKDAMDQWIIASTQKLVNTMTGELENYDLSATCMQLADSIDGLTNWYIRLSRRRFAGKGEGQAEAFDTLYRVILTLCQLLAPFCPFITEAIYDNLVGDEHGSIHFTDWPKSRKLTAKEEENVAVMSNTQTVVNLGLSLRSDAKVKVRQPLANITFALAPSDTAGVREDIIKDELNVKEVKQVKDPGSIAQAYVLVDARKVGPRLGSKVQELIAFGKAGKFELKGSKIVIFGEELTHDEAKVMYKAVEVARPAAVPPPYKQTPKDQLPTTNGGENSKNQEPNPKQITNTEQTKNVQNPSPNPQVLSPNPSPSPTPTPSTPPPPSGPLIAADHGIVISLDTTVSQELLLEGVARDIIRSVQKLRKDSGLAFTDSITLTVSGADDVLAVYKDLIARETRSAFGTVTGEAHPADIEGRTITLQFSKN